MTVCLLALLDLWLNKSLPKTYGKLNFYIQSIFGHKSKCAKHTYGHSMSLVFRPLRLWLFMDSPLGRWAMSDKKLPPFKHSVCFFKTFWLARVEEIKKSTTEILYTASRLFICTSHSVWWKIKLRTKRKDKNVCRYRIFFYFFKNNHLQLWKYWNQSRKTPLFGTLEWNLKEKIDKTIFRRLCRPVLFVLCLYVDS